MSFLISLSLSAVICLYFAVVSLIPLWSQSYLLFFSCTLFCGLGCWMGNRFPSTKYRLLGIGIPFLPFFIAWKFPETVWVILAPMVLAAILAGYGKVTIDYWRYRNVFSVLSVLYLLLLVACAIAGWNWKNALLFGLPFLIIGVFVLRQLRFGIGTGRKEKLLDAASILGVFGGILLISFLCSVIPNSFGKILEYLLLPLAMIFRFFIWIITGVGSVFSSGAESSEEAIVSDVESLPDTSVSYDFSEVSNSIPAASPVLDKIVGFTLLAILFLGVLYFVIRSRKNSEKKTVTELTFSEGGNVSVDSMGSAETRISNSRAIRKIYRKYLRYCQFRGFCRRPSDTTEDVMIHTENLIDADASAQLRELYIRSRYDSDESITAEDIRTAKRLLREMKNKK